MEEKLAKLKELLAVQGNDGNWNYDDYMSGMYNGMELAVAIFEDRPPVYRDYPVKEDIQQLLQPNKEGTSYLDNLQGGTSMDGAMREMPKYLCNKEVHALKIAKIVRDGAEPGCETDGSAMITPADEGYAPFKVDFAYMSKHKPVEGGYFVVYEDGYKSFSPAEAFESGYSRI